MIARNSAKSKPFTQVRDGNMPKDGEPLSKGEMETLQQWIDAGAPDFNPPVAKREFLSTAKMFEFMQIVVPKPIAPTQTIDLTTF